MNQSMITRRWRTCCVMLSSLFAGEISAAPSVIPQGAWIEVPAPPALNPGSGGDVHFSYDPLSARVFNFGGDIYWRDEYAVQFGSTGASYRRTMIAYSASSNRWSVEVKDDEVSTPSGRCQMGIAYDPSRSVFYIYGGVSSRSSEGHFNGGISVYDPLANTFEHHPGQPSQIAYSGPEASNYYIWVMSADGSGDTMITTALGTDYYPRWIR